MLPLREFPDIDAPIVTISTDYPGASAEIVETKITQPIEDMISGVEGIKNINSNSRDGRSNVTIEFNISRDIDAAANDVRDAVAATKIKTVVGDVAWGGKGPFKNVSKTPLVLGQWSKGKKFKYELSIVNNDAAKAIPVGGALKLN